MYNQSTIKLQMTKKDSQEKLKNRDREKRKRQPETKSGIYFVKIIFQSLDSITVISKHSLTEIKQKAIWNEE